MNAAQPGHTREANLPITLLRPTRGWFDLDVRSMWQYRELLYFLVLRDIKVRYRQTVLGITWAILQPLISMLVFSVIFGRLARLPSNGLPYPVFNLAGLLPWNYFAGVLRRSSVSLVGNANLLRKVYFPRLIIPISAALGGLVDLGIAFLVLLGVMLWYGISPTAAIIWLPVFIVLATIAGLAVGLWFSALNVQYRDFGYIAPFLSQLWMYITPVVYSRALIPEQYQALYSLNPMAGVVEGFRWALLGQARPDWLPLLLSALAALVLLITGAAFFSRIQGTFADWA